MQKEKYALLISGNESRFADRTLEFERFLVEDSGFDPNNIKIILCNYMGNDYILEETQNFFKTMKTKEEDGQPRDAIIFYNGHGGKGTFFPNFSSLSYEEWGKLITHQGKFIFINQSCYSASAIPALEKQGLLPNKGLVLASAKDDQLSYGEQFLGDLKRACKNKEYFIPTQVEIEFLTDKYILSEEDDCHDEIVEDEDGTPIIKAVINNFGRFEEETVKKKVITKYNYPRSGLTLDYLLFKD